MKPLDFDEEWETLGLVLDRFNALEHGIAKVIRLYVQPASDRIAFVENAILHNAIIPFAAKTKLLLTIARESKGPKLSREKFHRLLNIRNAFAHGHVLKGLRVNRNALREEPYGPYLIVETLKGDGSVEEKLRSSVVSEFITLLHSVKAEVEELEKHLAKEGTASNKTMEPTR